MARLGRTGSLTHALGWLLVLGALLGAAMWALKRAEPPLKEGAAGQGTVDAPRGPALPQDKRPDAVAVSAAAAAVPGAGSSAKPTVEAPAAREDATAQPARRADEAATAAVRAARATPQGAAPPITPLPDDTARLAARSLTLPVQGVRAAQLTDTFTDARAGGGRRHDAIDIMAPAGTPVLAVEDGRLTKLFFSQGGGGITLYQFDPDERYAYYYAHLERYADGLQEGQALRRGQVIGYVGSTGNASADAPHLHFAITRLGPKKEWWKGEALNPYPILTSP